MLDLRTLIANGPNFRALQRNARPRTGTAIAPQARARGWARAYRDDARGTSI